MSFKLKSMPLAIASVIATGALSMGVVSPVMAQTTSAATNEASSTATQAPQRVVVTGSLISRTDIETATPVQVITSADIQKSGKTSIAELLSDLASNGAGTLGSGFSGAFANGAAGVSLRGLSVGSTLVLIDGHRMSPYAIGDDSQRSFVDVSNIPFDAIDSIEILKAGASSLYGSDAVAGVVNIKLKKSFVGTRFATEAGRTQEGGGATQRASLSTGIGDLDTDGYNVFATAEWRHQGAITVNDRAGNQWDSRDWRDRGGNNLALGAPVARLDAKGQPVSLNAFLTAASTPFLYNPSGAPLAGTNPVTGKAYSAADNPANFTFLDSNCNFAKYRADQCTVTDKTSFIQPKTDNINILLGATKKLSGDWELAFKASAFQRHSINNRGVSPIYSPASYAGATALTPEGVLTTQVGRIADTTFAPGAAVGSGITNTLTGNARLYGYIPGLAGTQTSDNTALSTRFALDLTGTAWGWDTRVAAGMTESKVDIDYSGYVDRAALYTLLKNGTFNVLGGNSPSVLAQVSPTFTNTLTSKLNYFDAVGSRDLMSNLGYGPVSLAAGVHYHKRTWDAPASPLTLNGQVGSTSAFVFGSETNTAVFGELAATPIKNTEFHISSRYDHFDTYGNSFTPAATFKWTPSKAFALRGSFARGFRAPNPAETGNAGSFFSFNAINDPILCPGGNRTAAGTVVAYCGYTPTYVQTTSKDLSPEKSKSYDLGIVMEPVKGLGATLDYYQIQVNNQIVSAAGADPNYVPQFVRGAPTQMDTVQADGTTKSVLSPVGPILYATSGYINAGDTKTSGIEAAINYTFKLPGELGRLRADLSAAHTFSYTQSLDGVTYQLAGTQGPSVVSGATGNPKDRAQFSLDWTKGPLDITASMNYTSSFSTLDPSVGATDCASTGLDAGGRTYYSGLTQPDYYCHVASFTATNLNVMYKVTSNLTLKGSILNAFNRQPPIDVGTYGNSGTQTSYNASLHQAGAVGRFFSLGLNYTF